MAEATKTKQLSPVKKAIASMSDSGNKWALRRFGFFKYFRNGEKAGEFAVRGRLILRAEKLEEKAEKSRGSLHPELLLELPAASRALIEEYKPLYAAAGECRAHVASLYSAHNMAAGQHSKAAEDFEKAREFDRAGSQRERSAFLRAQVGDPLAVNEYRKASFNYSVAGKDDEAKSCDSAAMTTDILLKQKSERKHALEHDAQKEKEKQAQKEARDEDLAAAELHASKANSVLREADITGKDVNAIDAASIPPLIALYEIAVAQYQAAVDILSKYKNDYIAGPRHESASNALSASKDILETLKGRRPADERNN